MFWSRMSHLSCIMYTCVRSVPLTSSQIVIVIMWNNISLTLLLPSALPFLPHSSSSSSAVCGTQWIPTLHWSCAIRLSQRLDLYWFSATCAKRLTAPHSLPPLLSFDVWVCHHLPGQLAHSVQCSPFVTNCQRLAGQWCVARSRGGVIR